MGATGSSIRLDPGWLFVAAGLTLCVAGVLIPAQQGLHDLDGQLRRIEHLHAAGQDGIRAHDQFLNRLRERDPAVLRRLAAAQLNLVSAGDTPLLVANSGKASVTDWIGRSVSSGTITATPAVRTWLSRLTAGTHRLWMLGFGVVVVFVGLLVDGGPPTPAADVEWSDDGADEEEQDDDDWSAPGEEDADEADEEADDDDDDDDELDEDYDDEDEEDEDEEEDESDDEDDETDWDEAETDEDEGKEEKGEKEND